jgi:hypothetical protein
VYRPLVIDLRVLFPILDDKRTLEKDRSVKKGTGIDDAQLGRAACDYLLARLKPSDGAQPLPPWFQRGATGDSSGEESSAEETASAASPDAAEPVNSAKAIGTAAASETPAGAAAEASADSGATGSEAATSVPTPAPGAAVLEECQAVVNCLSHDTWTTLERAPPPDLLEANEWVIAWRAKEVEAAAEAAKADETAADVAATGRDDSGGVATAGGASAAESSTLEANTVDGKAAEDDTEIREAVVDKGGASTSGNKVVKGAVSGGKVAEAAAPAAGGGSKPKGSKVSPAPAAAATAAPRSQAKERLQKSGRAVANAAAATKKNSRVAPANGK